MLVNHLLPVSIADYFWGEPGNLCFSKQGRCEKTTFSRILCRCEGVSAANVLANSNFQIFRIGFLLFIYNKFYNVS